MGSPTTVLAKITRSYPVRLPWWPCGHFVGQGGLPFWAFSFLPFFWKNGNMLFHPNVVSTTCFFFGFDTWETKLKQPYKHSMTIFAKCKDAPMCLKKIKLLVTKGSFQANLDSIIQHGRAEVLWTDETKPTGPLDLSRQILDDDELLKHLRGVANSQAKLKLLLYVQDSYDSSEGMGVTT